MKSFIKVNLVILTVAYLTSCYSPVADENAKNLKKIEVGMSIEEVKEIMGKPNVVMIGSYEKESDEFEFIYSAPSLYSGDFIIYISRKYSTVLRIYDGL